MKTKIINLIASPGSGKSTNAALLFGLMKSNDMSVELVSEYAKELTWNERKNCLKCQPYVFGKQLYRIESLIDRVDYIVTDSPLILGIYYAGDRYPRSFKEFIAETFKSMDNVNFLLERTKKYNPKGRNQTEAESNQIQVEIEDILCKYEIPYSRIKANEMCAMRLFGRIANDRHNEFMLNEGRSTLDFLKSFKNE